MAAGAERPPRGLEDSLLHEEAECVASHFLVCGLRPGSLQPLLPVEEGCDEVLTDICVVLPSKGEECPPGYTLIESTPDGQRASLNHGDVLGAPVFLAVCLEPITRCRGAFRPITGLRAIHLDRGERPEAGYSPISLTVGGHEANLNYGGGGRDIQLCVARAADSPPLCRVEVLVRGKAGLRVPTGCLLMRGDDGACTCHVHMPVHGPALLCHDTQHTRAAQASRVTSTRGLSVPASSLASHGPGPRRCC